MLNAVKKEIIFVKIDSSLRYIPSKDAFDYSGSCGRSDKNGRFTKFP
jgi:hypothetical protein